MDSRADRLLDEINQVVQAKRQELSEVEERLENSKKELSQIEAKVLRGGQLGLAESDQDGSGQGDPFISKQKFDEFIRKQRLAYEQQLASFNDELTELELVNKELAKENVSVRTELHRVVQDNEKLTAKYNVLSNTCRELENANLELNLQLAHAENESKMQKNLLKKTHLEDQVLMQALNDKLESMQKAIEWRDEEIKRLSFENDISSFELELGETGIKTTSTNLNDIDLKGNRGRQKVLEIVSAFREQDAQIEMLKSQLVQATKDLESNAQLIERLTEGLHADKYETSISTSLEVEETLKRRYKSMESELEAKDARIHAVEVRNHKLEQILPEVIVNLIQKLVQILDTENPTEGSRRMIIDLNGKLNALLADHNSVLSLLNDVESLNNVIKMKEKRILELVNDLNSLSSRMGIDKIDSGVMQEQAEIKDERSKGETSESEEADQGSFIEPRTESKQMSNRNVIAEPKSTSEEPDQASKEHDRGESVFSDLVRNDSFDLQVKLRRIENENELLELAMKEILLSIRWTDSQCSTILIDCPSLERLCQLIEARYLADMQQPQESDGHAKQSNNLPLIDPSRNLSNANLFQMIILKSELDLLRGQNEQLRAEMKNQRQDYLTHMSSAAQRDTERSIVNRNDTNSIECQTESIQMTDRNELSSKQNACENCSKLTKLCHHLLQAIVRIEERLNMTDEGYINRLLGLCDMIRLLEKDLTSREYQLSEARQRCYLLNQQKMLAESRLKYIESNAGYEYNPIEIRPAIGKSNEVSKSIDYARSVQVQPSMSPVVSQQLQVPFIGNAKMTISLLQSIIGCLQARLEHKDERLQRMESILAGNSGSRPEVFN